MENMSQATTYTGTTEYTLSFQELGPEGAAFRFENKNDEKQRQYILQNDTSGLTCTARLMGVFHGKFKRRADEDATLLLIDFIFAGSRVGGRRFRQAEVAVQFERRKPHKGQPEIDFEDPIVEKIAPDGYFVNNPSVQTQSTTSTFSAHAHGNIAGGDPSTATTSAGITIGLGYKRMQWMERQANASIEGQRISSENRTSGTPNVAQWILTENEQKKDGIPRKLQTAILLRPETAGAFEARVTVKTKVDWAHPIKNLFAQRVVDPVLFDVKGKRLQLGDILPIGLDLKNMQALSLEPFGIAG